eukprot:5188462-Alexandrium_andersonii.AAC.1
MAHAIEIIICDGNERSADNSTDQTSRQGARNCTVIPKGVRCVFPGGLNHPGPPEKLSLIHI